MRYLNPRLHVGLKLWDFQVVCELQLLPRKIFSYFHSAIFWDGNSIYSAGRYHSDRWNIAQHKIKSGKWVNSAQAFSKRGKHLLTCGTWHGLEWHAENCRIFREKSITNMLTRLILSPNKVELLLLKTHRLTRGMCIWSHWKINLFYILWKFNRLCTVLLSNSSCSRNNSVGV